MVHIQPFIKNCLTKNSGLIMTSDDEEIYSRKKRKPSPTSEDDEQDESSMESNDITERQVIDAMLGNSTKYRPFRVICTEWWNKGKESREYPGPCFLSYEMALLYCCKQAMKENSDIPSMSGMELLELESQQLVSFLQDYEELISSHPKGKSFHCIPLNVDIISPSFLFQYLNS
jgi:hypothetical protein